ncbi:hypothetical protein [Alicyclobacillus fodiniaquatilis]|uniref:Uncharacterized protein n=1 Tax=Alicyclobacillus fodiniaquatilis TaxID=1661150 RepID=A0ABW4JES4_9BACL
MQSADLQDMVRRVRKEGSIKLQRKAEALELITHAKIVHGYTFRISRETSFYYRVVDADDEPK